MRVSIEQLTDGNWSSGFDAGEVEDLNPADEGDVIGTISLAGPDAARHALDSAAAAFHRWRRTPLVERGAILARAADLLRDRAEAIAADITRENGKLLVEARVEVAKSADFLDYYAGVGRLSYGDLLDDGRPGTQVFSRREPIGVIVAIAPWNDPILTPARKLSPALIAGNTVVAKPSIQTPLALQHFARALHDAGLPAGVLNTVHTSNDTMASAVLADPRVSGVTVTGSTATGFALEKLLAGRSVRFQAEMGGKNPAVVLPDADLDLTVRTIAAAAYAQAGQRCTATSRVLVHRQVQDEFLDRMAEAAAAHRPGPGNAAGSTMGPLISRAHQRSVLEHVQRAQLQGAKVLTGGEAPTADGTGAGCFVAPAVVAGVTEEMSLWRDEVFGPVLAVSTIDDLDEAIAKANDTAYGLSAAIFTGSLAATHRFIEEVDAGQISVNLPTSGWDVHHPFGGFKDSGSAFKEQGLDGLRFYTRTKTAAIGHGGSW
ncbi:aldehyde dehydrogenase family protein [Arthrobacter sp. I2-34]|uniref:Aldehyde dehydrogenase family protein n=1 Tax=Arthrobacter hankyongi TaxID=2904801 RepID=A0ABS9LCP1_9MICC|nr:aldehyde dehydrogenase family protein [Arthrobacter hankyongi]MCG2624431.1 aldehyde dehydrogenase family protein [Arthrobacter hankyongi]